MEKKKWMSTPPKHCDICEGVLTKVFIDGQTVMGLWGIMCPSCHPRYGVGLRTGKGQKYNLDTLEKVEGDKNDPKRIG